MPSAVAMNSRWQLLPSAVDAVPCMMWKMRNGTAIGVLALPCPVVYLHHSITAATSCMLSMPVPYCVGGMTEYHAFDIVPIAGGGGRAAGADGPQGH